MQGLRRTLLALVVLGALVVTATALGAGSGKLKATPWTFDPDATGIIVSGWQGGVGEPDPNGNANQGLVLEKNGPTTTDAAAGATIDGVAGQPLSELGFDVKGYCGAGSPRFNVYDQYGNIHFFGCVYGKHTDLGNGWTNVSFTGADAFPAFPTNGTISAIEIVADEQGQSVLDNIDVNGIIMGKPGSTS